MPAELLEIIEAWFTLNEEARQQLLAIVRGTESLSLQAAIYNEALRSLDAASDSPRAPPEPSRVERRKPRPT